MASPFTVTSVSNYNSNPPSDDGAQTAANRVQWSTQKSKLADPIKTAFDASEANTATAFGKVKGGAGFTNTAVDFTVTTAEQAKTVRCTVSGKTITTPDATIVGSPFLFAVVNASSGSITLHGNGSQTVDGVASISIPVGCGVEVNTDGTNWFTDGQNFVLNNIAQAGTGISFNTSTTPPTINATASPTLFPNYISGLTLSTAGGSSTFGIAAGAANDSTNAVAMALASAYTKTTASWAVGSGNGSLDNGAIATGTTYHVYLIERPDTGVVDVAVSLSASAPTVGGTIPAAYTLSRRIGSMKTDGSSHWVLFHQFGDDFLLDASVIDINAATSLNGNALITLPSVPTGIIVEVKFVAEFASGGGGNHRVLFTSPDVPAQTPIAGTTSLFCANSATVAEQLSVRTNTSAQIRNNGSSTNCTYTIGTYGWIDRRGRT